MSASVFQTAPDADCPNVIRSEAYGAAMSPPIVRYFRLAAEAATARISPVGDVMGWGY